MTSKISTHKISFGKLMKEDLHRRVWMAALSLLGSFITSPVAFLFCFSSIRPDTLDPVQLAEETADLIRKYLCSSHLILQMTVIYVGVFIVSIYGFRYLYSRQMVDLYHSIPVTRGRLFWATYVNGFLIWFVPFLLGSLFVYLLSLHYIGMSAYWPGVTALLLEETGLFILCFLVLYNACLVPVMFSGNSKNAFLNILIFGLSILCCYLTALGYMSYYLDTFYMAADELYPPASIGLSPLASPIYLCGYFMELISESTSEQLITGSQWTALLLCAIAVMLFDLILAGLLHKKRPSELAERGVENKWFRIPLRFVTSLLAGLLLALFFGLLTENFKLGWTLFGAIFGCTLAFAIMNILHHASFKAIFNHKLQLFATLAVTCAIVLGFRFDILGYDTYLPDKESITGLSLYSSQLKGQGYSLKEKEDGYYKQTSSDMPDTVLFTDAEANYRLLETLIAMNDDEVDEKDLGKYRYSLTVLVNTTHGSYHRIYNVYQTPESSEALKPFVESELFRTTYYPAESGMLKPPSQILGKAMGDYSVLFDEPEKIEQLYQAYALDFAEHFDISSTSVTGNHGLVNLQYMYPRSGSGENTNYHFLNMNVPVWYERTLALLEQWNPEALWSQKDVDILSLQVAIDNFNYGYYSSDPLALLDYLGEITLTSAEQETLAKAAVSDGTNYGNYSWNRLFTAHSDTDELEQLKPYLYFGTDNSLGEDFVYIGRIKAVSRYNPEEFVECRCYMKKGAIPDGFVESLSWSEISPEN